MNPTVYTVVRINGDYAIMVSDEGIENTVAMALLPLEIDEGSQVFCENFEYSLITKI